LGLLKEKNSIAVVEVCHIENNFNNFKNISISIAKL
jgi:hypothetical protein